MADVGAFTTNAQIVARAGAHISASGAEVVYTDTIVLAVEAYVSAKTRIKWSGATSDVELLPALTEASACLCAMYCINYDTSEFPSLLDAQGKLDFLIDRAKLVMKDLDNENVRKFIQTGSRDV